MVRISGEVRRSMNWKRAFELARRHSASVGISAGAWYKGL